MLYNERPEVEKAMVELLFENYGEITSEYEELEREFNDNTEGLVKYMCESIANSECVAVGLGNELIRIKKQLDSVKNKIESKKEFIKHLTKGKKGQYGSFKIGYRKSFEVNILDESKVDKKFIKETVKYSVDKKLLKEALQNNEPIDYAYIVDNINLTIK